MRIDTAGQNKFIAGVNLVLPGREVAADRDDGLACNPDIGDKQIARRADGATTDDEIVNRVRQGMLQQ
jgi:hypothetical protein